MLTNRPPTSTIKASTSRHVANSRPTDDQNQDAGQDHHRRHRTHRQGVERAVDPSKLGTRSTASTLESKRLQEHDSDSNNHTSDLRERDRNNQKEQQQQQQQQQVRERDDHLHPHSSRQSRSTSRQRSGESSKHSRHHHHHHHHHHQRSSRPAVDGNDESALRTSIGRGRGRAREQERNNSPFDRPQSRQSTMDEDLANVSIRTNPGKRDGSGLLTIRDILDDPELQTVKGLTRGGEQLPQKQSSQIHQSQSRKALRPPLPEDNTEQGASSLKPNGKAAGGTSRRSQESLATQQYARTSDKPNRAAATLEDNRYDPSLTSNDAPLDRSPKLQQFRDRLDNFMSRVKQKATTGNDMKGYQDPVVRSQTTHSSTKGVPSTPYAIKRAPKDIPDFSMDDSVFITSMDDEQDDSEDEEDEDDTDVTQKTAEHIPSLARSNQAVASSSKARQPPNNSAGTATNAPSTRAKQPQDKMGLSRHAPQRPDIEDHDQDDEDLSDDPGYENFDSFARETALARARREQAKGQQLRKSSSKTGRSPSLETKGASGSVEQWSHTSPSLLGLPAPATTSRANSKSPATVSSSKSPLVSPRFVGVDGGVVSNHRSSFNRSLRKEQQQQQQQQPLAVGVPSSLNKLSISPVHVPVNTTPTTTTHTRRRTLDHGRDLALEDLTSPTGQDPVMGGILGGRRGSKKPTLLTADDDDDDRFPRPSIMSPYMRLNEPVQLHDHAATEGRFFDLAGSIGEGQAVSHVYDMLKDQIRRLKREKKALLSVIKSLKKDIRKAQRELARERREKDALSASLSAYSSASPSSRAQDRKNNGTKVEQVLESLQQRVEAIEGLVATKEKLIEEQNKELSILHAGLSEDEEDSDLESEESESDDDDEEDEEDEEEEPLRLSRAISAATPQAGKSHRKDTKRSSLKGKDKHRSSPALIDRTATGSSVPLDAATSPSPAVPATASSSSLRRSKDSKQEQTKVGENVVRFEVPLPSNMRASQVVYLPSLSHSLSALASLSMSPSSVPPGTGGDPKGLFIPATILSTQATTAVAAAAALTALSSSPSPSLHHQKVQKDGNDHHHEQETDEDGDDGEDEQRGADQRSRQSALSRSGSSKDQGAGTITVSTRPKPVMDPTVIKTIDSLRRSIGRYESPTAASRRQGETMEPEDNSRAQQEDSNGRQSEQMPDQQTQGDTLRRSKAVYGDEISMKSSTGPTAGKDGGEDESESRQGRSERSVSGRFDLDEQSMIDSDIEARPPKIHIDMDRVLSLLKAHNPKRCVVCNSQHAGGSRDRNSHTHHKDSRRHEVNMGDHQCQNERPQKPSLQSHESRAEASDQQPKQTKNIPTVDDEHDEQGQQAPPNSHEGEDQQVQQPDDDKNANDIDAELNEIMDGFYHRLGFAEHNYRGSYRELQELHTLLEQYKRSCEVDPQKLATAEQKIQRIEQMLMQAAQLFKTTEQKFHE